MAIEYTWEILSLYTTPTVGDNSDVIHQVNWRFQATEGNNYADIYRVTDLPAPSGDSFDAYEDLTEDQIIGWVKGQIDYDALVEEVNAGLQAQKTPEWEEKAVPWDATSKYDGTEQYLLVIDDDPNTYMNNYGPFEWRKKLVTQVLSERVKDEDIDVQDDIIMYRKGLLPIDSPLVMSDRVKIYKAVKGTPPDYDERIQERSDLTWVLDTGVAVGTWNVTDNTVDEAKAKLFQKLHEEYVTRQITEEIITVNGKSFKLAPGPQYHATMVGILNGMADDETIPVRDNSGLWNICSKSDLEALLDISSQKMRDLANDDYSNYSTINNCTSLEDITAAYTTIFGE